MALLLTAKGEILLLAVTNATLRFKKQDLKASKPHFFSRRSRLNFHSPVRGSLHFQEMAAEGHHLTPEAEQTVMFPP